MTKKEVGSSAVLGCRYHGWSYDTKGKLIKAPEFDTMQGFEKAANGLWEVKTQVQDDMVFVNFDAGNEVAALKLERTDRRLKRWGVLKMTLISDWKVEGAFNWKLAGMSAKITFSVCANHLRHRLIEEPFTRAIILV